MASDAAGSSFNSVVYPQGQVESFRTLSVVLALTATTVISYCFAQRTYDVDFFSRRGLSSIKIPRWLLLLLFLDSWAFVFLSGALVNGVGMSLNPSTCSLGVFACIFFYCISKLLTYLFLLEKVYIVWPGKGGRLSSIPYRIGFCATLGFVLVLIMMVVGRIAYLTEDRQCVIGLQRASSMTTLFVDLFVNVLLTSLFVWPLWRSRLLSPKLRRVASRTLIASFAALTISAVNLTILTILHGQELGWICLASCTTDVVVNAMVLFWLTKPRHTKDEPVSYGEYSANHGPAHNNRSQNGNNIGGATVNMHRIGVTHGPSQTGSSMGTPSINGISRASTDARTPVALDLAPRSPMSVNWCSHSGVYNPTQPYVRDGVMVSTDEKTAGTIESPASASLAQVHIQHPAFSKAQKGHSVDFVHGKKVTMGGGADGSYPIGFFNKLIGKCSQSDCQRDFGSDSKKRHGPREDPAGARTTITTMVENNDTVSLEAAEASDPNSSREDQSRKGVPHAI